jgi:hypothetical protein
MAAMAKGDVIKQGISKSNEFKSKLEDFKTTALKKLRGALSRYQWKK